MANSITKLSTKQLVKTTDKIKLKKPTPTEILIHELKTPLIGIFYHLDELKKNKLSKNHLYHLNSIFNTCQSLLKWLDQVHSSKKNFLDFKPPFLLFNLKNCIQEVIDNLVPYAKKKKISIFFKYPKQDLPQVVFGAPFLIQEIFFNLLHNSIKYSNSGTITCQAKLSNSNSTTTTIIFIIKDQGIGISPKNQNRVFLPFYQQNKNKDGSGLGLYITKKICKLLNGEIKFSNQKELGTKLTLKIPFEKSLFATNTKKRLYKDIKQSNVNESNTFKKVLIIEDNPIQQEYLSRLLVNLNCGYDPIIVSHKKLNKRLLSSCEIIFLDLHSVEVNSDKFTTFILTNADPSKVILTSAYLDKKNMMKLSKLGFKHYLAKPILLENLVDCLQKIEKSISFNGNSLKQIDWKLSLSRANNDKALAEELFIDLLKNLPNITQLINKLYQQKSFQKLSSIIHYLKGALCYTGIPQLEKIVNLYDEYLTKRQFKLLKTIHSDFLNVVEGLLALSEIETTI